MNYNIFQERLDKMANSALMELRVNQDRKVPTDKKVKMDKRELKVQSAHPVNLVKMDRPDKVKHLLYYFLKLLLLSVIRLDFRWKFWSPRTSWNGR